MPVAWVLMTKQTTELYKVVLDLLVSRVGGENPVKPESATCDFEPVEHNSLKDKFSEPGKYIDINGCRFHKKKACRKRLLELQVENNQIGFLMRPGVLDTLAVM